MAERHVTLADAQVQQPSLQPRLPGAVVDAPPSPASPRRWRCWRFILGHGSTSRLYRNLVVDRELAVSAGGYYSGTALDATQFGVYGSPKPGVSLQKLEDAIDAVLDDVIAKGVTADEVERAKNRLIADAIYAQDSQATMARWYGAALTTGSTVESVQTWPDRIRAVTADAVNAAAKTWLDKRRSVTGYLVKDCPARGKENVSRRLRCPHCSRGGVASPPSRRRSLPARPPCSGWCRPAASRPGWCTSRRCRWSP